MKSLKEKFGKFEISKDKVKNIKGGTFGCTRDIYTGQCVTENPDDGENGGAYPGGNGNSAGGVHCPPGISEAWCHNLWTYECGAGQVCYDPNGYYACIATCTSCRKC
jgi:hypothetical protein